MSLAHNLTTDDLGRLQTLLNAGNVAEFWRVLSTDYHDTYADNAYAVIARPATPLGEFFGTLVERHWENTNPDTPNAYQDHFMAVGLRHATNYLNLLKLPEKLWPSSKQIERGSLDGACGIRAFVAPMFPHYAELHAGYLAVIAPLCMMKVMKYQIH